MARGWDRNGAWVGNSSSYRLICGSPPGPGGGVTPGGGPLPNYPRPNVFCGLAPLDLSPPLIVVGAGNFSIEGWYSLRSLAEDPTTEVTPRSGFYSQAADLNACFYCNDITPRMNGRFDDGGGGVLTGWDDVPLGWAYIAMNFNRVGNMDLIANGIVVQSGAITNNPISGRFYAMVSNTVNPLLHNGVWGDYTTFGQSRMVVGPVAAHAGLLTQAQLLSSLRGRRVQNLATTLLNYDWRMIERIDGDPIDWAYDEDLTHHMLRSYISGRGLMMPRGAPGTIRVPDLSGSGNHWVLPTLAAYARTAACDELSSTAFITDPFWIN